MNYRPPTIATMPSILLENRHRINASTYWLASQGLLTDFEEYDRQIAERDARSRAARNGGQIIHDSSVVVDNSSEHDTSGLRSDQEKASDVDPANDDCCCICGNKTFTEDKNGLMKCPNSTCKNWVHQRCNLPRLRCVPDGDSFRRRDCEEETLVRRDLLDRDSRAQFASARGKIDSKINDNSDADHSSHVKRSRLVTGTRKPLRHKDAAGPAVKKAASKSQYNVHDYSQRSPDDED
jgi:hypothetical protein